METTALPEAQARCTGVRALAGAVMGVVLAVALAVAIACGEPERFLHVLKSGWAGELGPKQQEFERTIGLVVVTGLSLFLYLLAGLAAMLWQLAQSRRWRGTEVRITPDELLIGRPPQLQRLPWGEVRRLPCVSGEFTVIPRQGDVVAVPLLTVDEVRLRAAEALKAWHGARWLAVLARAYYAAHRRGLRRALNEPPLLYMRGLRRSPRHTLITRVLSGLLLASFAVLVAGLPIAVAFWMPLGEVAGLTAVMAATLGPLLWLLWRSCKSAVRRVVRADPHGLMFWDGRQRRFFPWGEITEMWRLRWEPHGGVAIRVAGKRYEVPPTSIRYANLALLTRTETLRSDYLLLAAWDYYGQQS